MFKDQKIDGVTICLDELTDSHTSEYICEKLNECLTRWNVDKATIVAAITDNGANIVKAIDLLIGKRKHLPCCVHTLNLVAQTICQDKDISFKINNVKEIVKYFKQSVKAADRLRTYTDLKLIQSVIFLELANSIGNVLMEFPKSPIMITAMDLMILKELCSLLEPLEQAITDISGDKYVTSSLIIPMIDCLKNQISGIQFESGLIHLLQTNLLKEIEKRFGLIEENSLLSISTLLDPRFKKLHFKKIINVGQSISKIKTKLKNLEGNSVDEKSNVQFTISASTESTKSNGKFFSNLNFF